MLQQCQLAETEPGAVGAPSRIRRRQGPVPQTPAAPDASADSTRNEPASPASSFLLFLFPAERLKVPARQQQAHPGPGVPPSPLERPRRNLHAHMRLCKGTREAHSSEQRRSYKGAHTAFHLSEPSALARTRRQHQPSRQGTGAWALRLAHSQPAERERPSPLPQGEKGVKDSRPGTVPPPSVDSLPLFIIS